MTQVASAVRAADPGPPPPPPPASSNSLHTPHTLKEQQILRPEASAKCQRGAHMRLRPNGISLTKSLPSELRQRWVELGLDQQHC